MNERQRTAFCRQRDGDHRHVKNKLAQLASGIAPPAGGIDALSGSAALRCIGRQLGQVPAKRLLLDRGQIDESCSAT
jgi:hypothetical protein